MNSLDSALLFLIIDLVAEKGTILYNDQIWDKVKNEFRDYEFEDKSYSYYSEIIVLFLNQDNKHLWNKV